MKSHFVKQSSLINGYFRIFVAGQSTFASDCIVRRSRTGRLIAIAPVIGRLVWPFFEWNLKVKLLERQLDDFAEIGHESVENATDADGVNERKMCGIECSLRSSVALVDDTLASWINIRSFKRISDRHFIIIICDLCFQWMPESQIFAFLIRLLLPLPRGTGLQNGVLRIDEPSTL